MFKAVIDALNSVNPRVWSFVQFAALIGLVVYGGHLMIKGHPTEGTALMTGAFALARTETGAGAGSTT